jgi:hypothetical protein
MKVKCINFIFETSLGHCINQLVQIPAGTHCILKNIGTSVFPRQKENVNKDTSRKTLKKEMHTAPLMGLLNRCRYLGAQQCCGSESERIRAFLAETESESEIFDPDSDPDPDPVI